MQAPLSSRVVINAYRCIEPLLKQLHSHVGTHHCCDTYHRQTATSTMRSYYNFTLPASVSVTVLDEPTHIQWRCTIACCSELVRRQEQFAAAPALQAFRAAPTLKPVTLSASSKEIVWLLIRARAAADMVSRAVILAFVALGVAVASAADSTAASQISASTPTWDQMQKSKLLISCAATVVLIAPVVDVAGVTVACSSQTGWA